ncbi:MAG TPA: 16S rRNA (cytosine(1402)-N(4))-methyltransferase RsmH [Vicinamibacterales bacterium]
MHEPVMVAEVLEHLEPARGGVFVDCTVGPGGHARALLEGGASKVIGIDRDPAALEAARGALAEYRDRVELVHGDYRRIADLLDARGIATVDGLMADLGVSSMQLDAPGRGFSFRRDDPLDMRMDTSSGATAAELIRAADERTLADVIYEFGEERHARRVARAIVEANGRRAIETTGQLADVVRRAIPRTGYSRIDPATRTFQAIRIWVNGELEGLDAFLADAAERLAPGGRMAVITFHSLEDRIVKHTLRGMQAAGELGITVRTKRPMVPAEAEVERNPRARSAKLRAIGRAG